MSPKRDPARPSAVHGMLIEGEGFHDLPFGGRTGELSPAAPATPTPPPLRSLAIEPPPWAGEDLDLSSFGPPPPTPSDELSAVDAMKLATGDGFDPPPPGPPEVVEPLVPWAPPEPDWREEEEGRLTRNATETEPPQATPNLDAVKSWRKGAPQVERCSGSWPTETGSPRIRPSRKVKTAPS